MGEEQKKAEMARAKKKQEEDERIEHEHSIVNRSASRMAFNSKPTQMMYHSRKKKKKRCRAPAMAMSSFPVARCFAPADSAMPSAQSCDGEDGYDELCCDISAEVMENDEVEDDTSSDPKTPENPVKDGEQSPQRKDTMVFAAMPKVLDRAIELHDKNAAIRSTTIKTANFGWTLIRKENLLSGAKKDILGKDQISTEKSKAFDLLEALSRSGSLEIPFSELHVLICATHHFEKNVMETVIRDNINPIEKLEMSALLMASTIMGIPSRDLIRGETDRKRLEKSFPLLLGAPTSTRTQEIDNADEMRAEL